MSQTEWPLGVRPKALKTPISESKEGRRLLEGANGAAGGQAHATPSFLNKREQGWSWGAGVARAVASQDAEIQLNARAQALISRAVI
jgi:hypothetical protein